MTNPEMSAPDSEMFTVEQAGEKLGLTRPQVYRRVEQGALVGVRARVDGRQRWLITPESVERYAAGGVDLVGDDTGELLRVPAAAKILGYTPEHVRRLVRSGELAAKRGEQRTSQIRILRSSIEKYLSSIAE